MSNFYDTMQKVQTNVSVTENGMVGYKTTYHPLLDMNFKVSSYRLLWINLPPFQIAPIPPTIQQTASFLQIEPNNPALHNMHPPGFRL